MKDGSQAAVALHASVRPPLLLGIWSVTTLAGTLGTRGPPPVAALNTPHVFT